MATFEYVQKFLLKVGVVLGGGGVATVGVEVNPSQKHNFFKYTIYI